MGFEEFEVYSSEYDEWWPAKDEDGFERLRINEDGVLELWNPEYCEWQNAEGRWRKREGA